jgi:PhnB protein
MRVNAYLYFDGKAEEAFHFYAAATGAAIGARMTYGDAPADVMEGMGGASMRDKMLHISLDFDGSILMGSDAPPGQAKPFGGFAVTLSPATAEEADRVFAALADGGQVTMPLGPTFWTQRFGMLVDRFGVPWLINMDGPPPPA